MVGLWYVTLAKKSHGLAIEPGKTLSWWAWALSLPARTHSIAHNILSVVTAGFFFYSGCDAKAQAHATEESNFYLRRAVGLNQASSYKEITVDC